DQLLGASLVEEAGELNQDSVVPLLLDGRLRHAELVDSVADDLHRLVGRLLRLGGTELRLVHLEEEVHPPLEVEAELDRAVAKLGHLLEAGSVDIVGGGGGAGLAGFPATGRGWAGG